MSYPEATSKATIKVKEILLENYMIMNIGPARQILESEIHSDDTGISLCQEFYITKILR
jgi:hypothetical protein